MHVEVCVEDASGRIVVESIMERYVRPDVSWRVHSYRGVGHIPKNLGSTANAGKRILLDNLPKLIRGCASTPYVSVLIIVVDSDNRDCADFLQELKDVHAAIAPTSNVVFRIAIEEIEAWLLGDPKAVEAAYQIKRRDLLASYIQDSVCGTWERLADIIHSGGAAALIEEGWPAPGIAKSEWAREISPLLNLTANRSPSFNKFLEALEPYR